MVAIPGCRVFEKLWESSRSLLYRAQCDSDQIPVALDLAALLQASQALSDEIVLDKLLAKLMVIFMESAGAQRGCLLLERNGVLQIEAESHVESKTLSISHVPMTSDSGSDRLSLAIVHYVARTQESVVLNDATQDYRFNQDA
jgi:GAF domain-containing protein